MRFKSVFAAFFFVLFTSLLGLLIYIQTNSFGKVFSRIISDISQKRAQAEVDIQNLRISVFPPGLELNKVKVSKKMEGNALVRSELGKLGIYFSLLELEEQKISFGELRISDSVIEYHYPTIAKTEDIQEIDQIHVNEFFGIAELIASRVGTLIIENTKFVFNHEIMEAKRFKIFKEGKNLMTRFHLANITPLADKPYSVDEVWGDAEISREEIKFHRLKVQHDVNTLLVKGNVKNYRLIKNAEGELLGEAQLHLKNFNNIYPLPEDINIKTGVANINFNFKFSGKQLIGKADISINKLKSSVIFAEEIYAGFSFNESELQLNKFHFQHKDEELNLISGGPVFKLQQNQLLPVPLEVKAKNVTLNNVLRILGPKFKVLKGKLTGIASISMKGMDIFIKPKDGFIINDLGLVVGNNQKPFTVLMVKKATLSSGDFGLINKEFKLSTHVKLANSSLEVDGFVNAHQVRFASKGARVNYEDLGNLANLDIKGKGALDVNVQGPISDTVITINGFSEGFEILGYKLGQVDKSLSISLKDANVIINKFEGLVGRTALSGTGAINYDNLDIALGINTNQARYQDLKNILAPIFSELNFLPQDLDFTAKVDAAIHGKASMLGLKVKSNVNFKDLVAFGEYFNNGNLTVQLADEVVTLKELDAHKGSGSLMGDFSLNLNKKWVKLDYRWENLILSSFSNIKSKNLNIDGKIAGSLKGEGPLNDYSFNLNARVFDTLSQNYKFEDSYTDLKITPHYVEGTISLIGNLVDAKFDLALDGKRSSELSLNIDIPNVKPLGVAFIGQHLATEDFTGQLRFNLEANFKEHWNDLNLTGSLQELHLKYADIGIHYFSNEPTLKIVNSVIKRWDFNVRQPDFYFTSTGEGIIGKSSKLNHELHFNAKLLELMVAPILSAEGFVRNVFTIEGSGDDYYLTATSKGSNLTMSINQLPFPVNDLRYDLEYSNQRLLVKDFTTALESGTFSLKGDVFFEGNDPDINLKYVLDKAEIPILGKSLINISGEGIILGNDRPYNLSGEILVNKGYIINELNEFNNRNSALSQIRFLPKTQESPLGKMLNLNLNVKADNNIRISNSLMDVGLQGEVRLTGNPSRPRAEGRLFSPVNTSRVFFKNNEYAVTHADIIFSPRKEITNPDFDIQAQTFITSYRVYAKAYGDLERFNFDLTSDPALSRNSVLSLIAFGYTDEIQSSLSQDQQQNLTQVGMGSFVFDRFKISDILNRQFGLQVNLGSVFEQHQSDSLLSGRSQEGQGMSGGLVNRTRSATKIELKKRLDEATTLSVSSTMGGNIGQRQSMNLNYSLSKKVQVEGVYELRTNAEGEEDVIDNSIGADLKFRWTFK